MLSQDQRDFYTRWRNKADVIVADSVENCIDKYVSYFICYNALYNIVPEKVSRHTGVPVPHNGDKVSATLGVLSFLGPNSILEALNNADIQDLHAVMANKYFNIKFNTQGIHQPNIDTQLTNSIASADFDKKTLALLETLYYIRCNIVHGKKGLAPYQMLLLGPIINLIGPINNLLFTRLRDYPI